MSEAPDLTTKVLGYRSWDLRRIQAPRGTTWGLESTATPYVWLAGVNTARCEAGIHDPALAPDGDCDCGLYAYHDLDVPVPPGDVGGRVWGTVRGWGPMEVHEDGWRARHAEILALTYSDTPGQREAIEHMASIYNVPAIPVAELKTFAENHAAPVPTDMLPTPEPPPAPGTSTHWHHTSVAFGPLRPGPTASITIKSTVSTATKLLALAGACINIAGIAATVVFAVPWYPFGAAALYLIGWSLARLVEEAA